MGIDPNRPNTGILEETLRQKADAVFINQIGNAPDFECERRVPLQLQRDVNLASEMFDDIQDSQGDSMNNVTMFMYQGEEIRRSDDQIVLKTIDPSEDKNALTSRSLITRLERMREPRLFCWTWSNPNLITPPGVGRAGPAWAWCRAFTTNRCPQTRPSPCSRPWEIFG